MFVTGLIRVAKKTFHGHSLPSPPTLLHIFAAFIYIYNLRQSNVAHTGLKSKKGNFRQENIFFHFGLTEQGC